MLDETLVENFLLHSEHENLPGVFDLRPADFLARATPCT